MMPAEVQLPEHPGKKPFSRTQIKYIAIVLMLADHIASLCGGGTLYFTVRLLGRITAPVMAFFIAEGYRHTRNVRRYLLRLALFALISAVPFRLFESGTALPLALCDGTVSPRNACWVYFEDMGKTLVYYRGSVITTLFLGLLAIVLWDRSKLHIIYKLLLTAVICRLADFSDWSCWLVLYCLAFYAADDNRWLRWALFTSVSLLYAFNIKFSGFTFTINPSFQPMRLGTFLALALLEAGYNGSSGSKTAFSHWFFYAFYPAHLLILFLVRTAVD